MRQALAGMLWSKQFFFFDRRQLAGGHGAHTLKSVAQATKIPKFRMVSHAK